MNTVKSVINLACGTLVGGAIGYGSALILPTVSPLAGAINGAVCYLIFIKAGDYAESEKSIKDDKLKKCLINSIAFLAGVTLSFLICMSAQIPITFTACLIFPWQTAFLCAMVIVPCFFINSIYSQGHGKQKPDVYDTFKPMLD